MGSLGGVTDNPREPTGVDHAHATFTTTALTHHARESVGVNHADTHTRTLAQANFMSNLSQNGRGSMGMGLKQEAQAFNVNLTGRGETVCVCVYIYIYTYMCVCVCKRACMYSCLFMRVGRCNNIYVFHTITLH
jgi:hypothetical protein